MKITQQNDYHKTPSIKSCYSKYVPLAPIEIIFKPNYIFIFLWAFTLSFSFCPKWLVVWLAFFDENNNEQVYGIFLDWRQEPSWSPHSVAWKLSQQLCEISGRHNPTFMFSETNKQTRQQQNQNHQGLEIASFLPLFWELVILECIMKVYIFGKSVEGTYDI